MPAPPMRFRYEGEGEWKAATPFIAKRADGEFVIGSEYVLVEHKERSRVSHSHYFASVQSLWENLPESLAPEFPTSEHLRKKVLIRTGYADEQVTILDTEQDAMVVAGEFKKRDQYCIVSVSGRVVKTYIARSQNMRTMNHEEFQASKTAVLEYIEDKLLGVKE